MPANKSKLMHKTKVMLPQGGFQMMETPIAPFEETACLVLKAMRWQDRGYKYNFQMGTTIMLSVTPANDWAHRAIFIPERFHYGEHFKEITR